VYNLHGKDCIVEYAWRTTAGINPLRAELNPFRHSLALLGAHYILHVSRIRVKALTPHCHQFNFKKIVRPALRLNWCVSYGP